MSDVLRRAAEIQAAREAAFEQQNLVYTCQDICRYMLPNLASRAAETDGKAALEALEALKRRLEEIASGR